MDGQIGTGGSFGAVLSDGTHTITAAVTDSGGQTSDAFITIEVQPASGVTVTVASLTGSSTTINKNFWKATVTATIDPALAVSVVSGVWEGDDKAANCTTDDLGQCEVSINVKTRESTTIIFTVTGVALTGHEYVLVVTGVTVNTP